MTWVTMRPTRRVLLTATGVALLGACGSPAEKGKADGSQPEPMPAEHQDPVRDRAIAAETALLARYDAALALPSVKADSGLSAKLKAIRAEHAAHVAAIKQGYTQPSTPPPSASPASSGSGTQSSAATDAKTTVAALVKAEQDAASARTADILTADGPTAMLLASVAASESGHAALLLGGAA